MAEDTGVQEKGSATDAGGDDKSTTPPPTETGFAWKSQIGQDFANSPTIKGLPDTKEGLDDAMKGYLSLEKMLGHEKVPIPKGDDDAEGWSRFSKAMGVPDRAEQYGLSDVEIPKNMVGLSFNKQEFSEIAHGLKLTPGQTKSLWDTYTSKSKEGYAKALESAEANMTEVKNRLMGEWGDAYEGNVQLGQTVIDKFTAGQEASDYVTAQLLKNPHGVRFLAKIGEQFSENKIDGFQYQRFSKTPDEAEAEINKIMGDPNHPYMNDRAPDAERQKAIDYVNRLQEAINKGRG